MKVWSPAQSIFRDNKSYKIISKAFPIADGALPNAPDLMSVTIPAHHILLVTFKATLI